MGELMLEEVQAEPDPCRDDKFTIILCIASFTILHSPEQFWPGLVHG
jgi:hypothetical protein